MRFVKRGLCALLTLLLLASLAPAPSAAADTVFFLAANEQLLPLNDETMPFWLGGMIYVPSTLADGTDLGLHYSLSRDRMSAVVYKQRDAITFDLVSGGSKNSNNQVYSASAAIRGGTVFLPLDLICRFFGLEYSYTRITYGYLIRVKNESVVLTDAQFINAATSLMAQRYGQYDRAHTPPADDPSTPSSPSTESPPQQISPRTIYPVFEITGEAYTEQLLADLSCTQATFLAASPVLDACGGLLRRLTADGAALALRVDASAGPEETLRRIGDANRALWAAANVKTRLILLDGADEETARVVQETGYCPLRFALDYSESYPSVSRMSTRIFSAADARRGSCCVFLGTDEAVSGILPSLLSGLSAGNCTPARLNEVVA